MLCVRCAVETCVASEDDVLMASGPGKHMALYEVGVILVYTAFQTRSSANAEGCLLYTSDAADE